jgi:hypothetical protein
MEVQKQVKTTAKYIDICSSNEAEQIWISPWPRCCVP